MVHLLRIEGTIVRLQIVENLTLFPYVSVRLGAVKSMDA